jgi:hypothetical protein
LATIVKKTGVKTHDRSHSKISSDRIASRPKLTGPEFLTVGRLWKRKAPARFPAGRKSNYGFSPGMNGTRRQKNACQDSRSRCEAI